MADKAHCSDMIRAKRTIRNALFDDRDVVALIVNYQNVQPETAEYDKAQRFVMDYRYVDETVQQAAAWVMVETECDASSGTMKDLYVYIEVLCSKQYMELDGWRGVSGNRRDNLLIQVDRVVNGMKNVGIGKINLEDVRVVSAPNGFTSIVATYVVPDFLKVRGVGNYA